MVGYRARSLGRLRLMVRIAVTPTEMVFAHGVTGLCLLHACKREQCGVAGDGVIEQCGVIELWSTHICLTLRKYICGRVRRCRPCAREL